MLKKSKLRHKIKFHKKLLSETLNLEKNKLIQRPNRKFLQLSNLLKFKNKKVSFINKILKSKPKEEKLRI
jgi:hypothetical protein